MLDIQTALNEKVFSSLVKELFAERIKNKNLEMAFINEADLQFALGRKLQEKFPEVGIHFEYRVPLKLEDYERKLSHPIDIVIVSKGKKYPIEIKYNAFNGKKCLAGTEDENICRCNFLLDIILTESVLKQHEDFEKGYCLFLTNNVDLYDDPKDLDCPSEQCKIHSRSIETPPALKYEGKNKNLKRPKGYKFKKNYELKWSDEIQVYGYTSPFKLLTVQV